MPTKKTSKKILKRLLRKKKNLYQKVVPMNQIYYQVTH